jgi:hypothetical protein
MTILFRDDWEKYPHAIVDMKTLNPSFIRYALLLKKMGVENHAWPLQLHDRDLQGVDPYEPNLPRDVMFKIAIECKNNIFYFMREVARDPKGQAFDPIRFKANRGNMALFWLYMNHITNILVVPRQTTKSFTISQLSSYLLNIAYDNGFIALLTKDLKLQSGTLLSIKDMIHELPYYLRQLKKSDIANTEDIQVSAFNNRFLSQVPNASPKQALNCFRGHTSNTRLIDEGAFIKNAAICIPAMLATGTSANMLSEKKGEPYGTIITTTANRKDERDSKYIYNMAMNSAIWSEHFMDAKDLTDLETIIRKNSPKKELRVYTRLTHKQLGYTDEWLKRTMELAESTGDAAEADYLCRWVSGTNTSPLSKELAEKIKESQIVDYYSEISHPYGYITRWYLPQYEVERRMSIGHYVMGLDTSDAAGGDDIAMILRDIRTGEVVAAGNYNETNLITFSDWLCNWLDKYRNITLIIERRSTGAMIIDYLLLKLPTKDIDPFTRLYNKVIQEADEYPDRLKDISRPLFVRGPDFYSKYKRSFGFATSATGATSRTELYSTTLLNAAKITGDYVKDGKTIDQILGLEIRNGRVDHRTGDNGHSSHDDMVIAWLLSYWLISLGKNLTYYGIKTRDVLSENRASKEANTPSTLYYNREQAYLRQEIENTVKELANEFDEYVSMKLEHKLKNLASKLNETDRATLSLDELITNIRDQRRGNKSRSRLY